MINKLFNSVRTKMNFLKFRDENQTFGKVQDQNSILPNLLLLLLFFIEKHNFFFFFLRIRNSNLVVMKKKKKKKEFSPFLKNQFVEYWITC